MPDQAAAVLRTFEPSSIVALGSIDAARRRVERIILRVGGIVLAVIVVAVAMVVFDEARAVGMRMSAVAGRHRYVKPVRLGNLVHGPSERAALGE